MLLRLPRIALGALLLIILGSFTAAAQTSPSLANVVTKCGSPNSTYTPGQNRPATQDTTGGGCDSPNPQGVTFSGATVGTTHAQVLPAGSVNAYLMLANPSAAGGNTVYCSFGGTATVAGAGTISAAPGQSYTWEGNGVPRAAIDCISTGANTPFTIGVN